MRVTTHTGGVDWNNTYTIKVHFISVTTHTGGVDWNEQKAKNTPNFEVTTHTGGVDWNIIWYFYYAKRQRSPPTRVVWIEMIEDGRDLILTMSPPTRVVWIEIVKSGKDGEWDLSPPTRVVWIEISQEDFENYIEQVTTHTGGVDWNTEI